MYPYKIRSLRFIETAKDDLSAFPRGAKTRAGYVARFRNAVYVLHAFQKKSQKTARRDIELARQRYRDATAIDEE